MPGNFSDSLLEAMYLVTNCKIRKDRKLMRKDWIGSDVWQFAENNWKYIDKKTNKQKTLQSDLPDRNQPRITLEGDTNFRHS